ncbi:uncharacterized protein LOC111332704 [Stylophora pistillata]|nr:uncharacterized protein LOC111332704 [Stylophora pistillata]
MYNSTSGQKWYKDVNYTTPGEAIEENLVYANYSVRVRARTKAGEGPYSEWHNTTTHKPAPTFVPQIITATATGNTTINVKWNCTGTPSNADYEGYKVRYGLRIPRSHLSTEVDRKPCEANLTRLKPFTEYFIRVAARTTQEGNYSKELSVTTHEGVPTAAPDVTWEILHSSEVRISWQRIPKPNHSGIIQGYHIEYHPEDNKTAVLKEDIKNEKLLSTVLKSLKKFSQYNIKVSAYTSVGDGPADSETFQTGDDIPSAAPINLTAINSVSPHKINVTWKPVPSGYMNGDLVDYEVNYQRVKIGGVPIDYEPVRSRITMNTTLTLENLDPYSEYEITVAARTKKGLGPRTLASYGETCPCERSFTTSWRRYEPYVNFTKDNEPGEIIPLVLRSMVRECCGKCQSYGQVELDFKHDGRSNSSERNSNQDLLDNLDESTDFTFPVSGYKEQDSYKGGYGFAPVIESAGVAFIVYPEKTQNQNTMYQSLLLCLPVLGLPIITAYIAGVIIWCLERSRNPHDFPPSFILGTWEGIWWSFVSMTTLGYGDRAPLSPRGRFFAIAWVLFGLVIISLTMAMIAAALTSITLKSEIKLYGSKVAAEFNSPEYNVGMRRNAKIDPDKPYYSVDEMTEALLNKEVEGILVDTYSAGLRGDLFNRPELRVNQIIDYKTAYGVVLGRHATQLGKCFERYLTSNRAEIFEMIKRKAKPIETSGSGETAEEDASGGLLDSGSPTFLKALRYACVSLGIALVFSLIYECIRCIRTRQKVHQNESHKAKLQEEMHALVGELNKRVLQIKMKLREKHVKQIIKYWKLQRKSMRETGMEKEWLRISTASPHNRELTISEI